MKNYILFLACFCLTCIMQAQEVNLLEETQVIPPKFMELQEPITVVNGDIYKYVTENFDLKANKPVTQGTIIVSFTVTKKGKVENFEVINSVQENLDKELVRVLKTTDGMWRPGMNSGNPVDMDQEVSIMVRSNESITYKDFVHMSERSYNKAGKLFYVKEKPRRALRKYNRCATLIPKDHALLMNRGLCYFALDKKEEARADWYRLKQLGGMDMEFAMEATLQEKDGYKTMMAILEE